ncbi:hypothetical protein B0T10DRAFT_459548 [Thelonectria olida]|uniref:Uncharacterized protein n=1 Tax=Thelonectria olida TaxID=1576542 RepID=A0A9P8W492_9HYPO|nr:hypothetical protein B0T10DRAFT_459548 [Thelonectria olida]
MLLNRILMFAALAVSSVAAVPLDDDLPTTSSIFARGRTGKEEKPTNKTNQCLDPEKVPIRTEFYGCEPVRKFTRNGGRCQPNWYHGCQAYCEMYTWWDYGREIPFEESTCNPGERCNLRNGMAQDITFKNTSNTSLIQMKILSYYSRFNFFDPNMEVEVAEYRPRPREQENTCGYWTFVPHLLHSCGVTSRGQRERIWLAAWCSAIKARSECVATVRQTPDGQPSGKIMFVATDCQDRKKRLGFCKQDHTYLEKGVSFDPSVRKDWLDAVEKHGVQKAWEKCQREHDAKSPVDIDLETAVDFDPPDGSGKETDQSGFNP